MKSIILITLAFALTALCYAESSNNLKSRYYTTTPSYDFYNETLRSWNHHRIPGHISLQGSGWTETERENIRRKNLCNEYEYLRRTVISIDPYTTKRLERVKMQIALMEQ